MHKLLIALAAIAALSMQAPNSGKAEPTHPNEVGLYLTEDGTGETGWSSQGVAANLYLVLTKPTDTENGDIPYSTIKYFECRLTFTPSTYYLFSTGIDFPPGCFNVGDDENFHLGYLEFIVGTYFSFPVTDESVVLVTFQFILIGPDVIEITLGPVDSPSIAGQMAFHSEMPDLQVMYPISGSHDAPVFIFNGEAVPVEQESFGSVKSLYR